jgi:NADPH-dependent 2,4-dienoyl-CoA reductase/sulfur reductase-like enzyme
MGRNGMYPIVIVGAVAAGMSAASTIKRALPGREVIVFGKENYISYAA